MVTIAFGQVFYFIAFRWNNVTGGDDGLTGWTRMPLDFGFAELDILHNDKAFYYLLLACSRSPSGSWRCCCARRSAARCWRSARTSAARAFSASRSTPYLDVLGDFLRFVSLAGALYALLNNFVDPRALCWTYPATSSSWRCWAACVRSGGR